MRKTTTFNNNLIIFWAEFSRTDLNARTNWDSTWTAIYSKSTTLRSNRMAKRTRLDGRHLSLNSILSNWVRVSWNWNFNAQMNALQSSPKLWFRCLQYNWNNQDGPPGILLMEARELHALRVLASVLNICSYSWMSAKTFFEMKNIWQHNADREGAAWYVFHSILPITSGWSEISVTSLITAHAVRGLDVISRIDFKVWLCGDVCVCAVLTLRIHCDSNWTNFEVDFE